MSEEKKKREFYVYRVTKEDSTTNNNSSDEKYIISPHHGKQPTKIVNESMGYRRDPSGYDFARPNHGLSRAVYERVCKELNQPVGQNYGTYREDINVIEEPKVEQNNTPQDDFYDVDPFEAPTPAPSVVRGDYVALEEPETASIEDLPADLFYDLEEEKPAKKEEKKTTVTLPKPKVANQNLESLEEKRAPLVNIPGQKVVKYIPPKLDMLTKGSASDDDDKIEAERQKQLINQTLADSNIKAEVADYIFGPTVTQFMIRVAPGVNVNSINNCASNLAMYLEAERIRIQTPIPGKPYAGIEVPKKEKYRRIVQLGDIVASKDFKETKCKIPVVVGKDNYGVAMICDIAEMPHCLIAGTTKSGKSVSLNAFLLSLIYKFSPRELRLVLIDPKRIELGTYEGIPHLAMPVITEQDDFLPAVTWVFEEMERRYNVFQDYDVLTIVELNKVLVEQRKPKLPYIVMIMDEFSDWITSAGIEVENMLQRIAQKARAAGIHVILAAQRPSKNVIKGDIKANFDTRLAFRVSSFDDAKIILGSGGAEKLEGYGDMLIRYAGRAERRLQGAFVSNNDVKKVVNFLKTNNRLEYIVTKEELRQSAASRNVGGAQQTSKALGVNDELFDEIAYYVVRNQNASVNSISRQFNTGFNRMNDIFLGLEDLGIVSRSVKGKSREVLVTELELEEILENK